MRRFKLRYHEGFFERVGIVLVDDEDAHLLRSYAWTIKATPAGHQHVIRRSYGTHVYLHREINHEGVHTYHKNGNGLDNRRCNLTPKCPATGPRFEKMRRMLNLVNYPDLEPNAA